MDAPSSSPSAEVFMGFANRYTENDKYEVFEKNRFYVYRSADGAVVHEHSIGLGIYTEGFFEIVSNIKEQAAKYLNLDFPSSSMAPSILADYLLTGEHHPEIVGNIHPACFRYSS